MDPYKAIKRVNNCFTIFFFLNLNYDFVTKVYLLKWQTFNVGNFSNNSKWQKWQKNLNKLAKSVPKAAQNEQQPYF